MLVRLMTSLMMVALLSCVEASAHAQADFRKESFNYSERGLNVAQLIKAT
jgi:2-iminobutanoate/2-iminopropanoate deaminase